MAHLGCNTVAEIDNSCLVSAASAVDALAVSKAEENKVRATADAL